MAKPKSWGSWIYRDNRLFNTFFGKRGYSFASLDDIVSSDCVSGVEIAHDEKTNEDTAKKVTPTFSYNNKTKETYLTSLLIEKAETGEKYSKLVNPKNYSVLLQNFEKLYGGYSKGKYCVMDKHVEGKDVLATYTFSGYDQKPRATLNVQINTETGETQMIYEPLRTDVNNKVFVNDLNRIFEILAFSRGLFNTAPRGGGTTKVPSAPKSKPRKIKL